MSRGFCASHAGEVYCLDKVAHRLDRPSRPETPRPQFPTDSAPKSELKLPGWAQLPAPSRHRLVSMLGELVLRQRAAKEAPNDPR